MLQILIRWVELCTRVHRHKPEICYKASFERITRLVKVVSHGKRSVAIDQNRNFVAEKIFSSRYATLKKCKKYLNVKRRTKSLPPFLLDKLEHFSLTQSQFTKLCRESLKVDQPNLFRVITITAAVDSYKTNWRRIESRWTKQTWWAELHSYNTPLHLFFCGVTVFS